MNTSLDGDLFSRLRHGLKNFSHQQQLVCRHILENYQKVAFMTVEELSCASGVSPATVVRTVSSLKYDSFHAMLEEIQKVIIPTQTSLWWQMENSLETGDDEGITSEGKTLTEVSRNNIEGIQDTLTPLLVKNFKVACDMLKKCSKLSILGLRSDRGAALYCYSMLHQFMDQVSLTDHAGSDEMYSELLSLSSKDLLLAIAVGGPHYSRRTIDAVESAHRRGIPVILITSDVSCPASPMADIVLTITATRGHCSLVPVMTIIDAIIVELSKEYRDKGIKKIRALKRLLVEKDITL